MKQIKNKKRKYNFGSFVQNNSAPLAIAGTTLGQIAGNNSAGDFLSGAGSGIGTGAAIGSVVPGIGTAIGAVAGGLIGGIGSIFGGGKRRRAEREAKKQQMIAQNQNYIDQLNSGLDTYNENPYGNMPLYALGGIVDGKNNINIEKGELQIDPTSGKILREYNGINPETGGLYDKHSKGKDTKHNIVTAEEGTFIVTKNKSKDYKDAIKNNDKLHQESILMNIRNNKDSKDKKFKYGSYVKYDTGGSIFPTNTLGTGFNDWLANSQIAQSNNLNRMASTLPATRSFNSGTLNTLVGLAPSLLNIGQGLFGKTERQPYATPIVNPQLKNITSNLPQDININPIISEMRLNNRVAENDLRNRTSSASIYRANRQQLASNLNRGIAAARMQAQEANNGVRASRANIYNNLGAQSMQEQARTQAYNLGIDQMNSQNRAAKSNLLNTGLSQLQQTYFNSKNNSRKQELDQYQIDLMMQMFPNLRYYSDLFNIR